MGGYMDRKKGQRSAVDEIGLPSLDEAFLIPKDDLVFEEQIGKGSFGNVYKGDYMGLPIAIKRIHKDMREEEELQRFIQREIAVSKFSHPNLVQFIGYSDTKEGLYLVSEWIAGLDLWKHLKRPDKILPWRLRAKMAYDAACGMAYLHARNIIHRDLKCKNLLVGENYRIKLCDFGFARRVPDGKHRLTICGTEEWMAPEVIMGADYGLQADVFSYGICLLEIITRKKTTTHLAFERTEDDLYELDKKGIEKLLPADCPESFIELAFDCVAYDDDKRPTFKDIIKRLRDVIAEAEAIDDMPKEEGVLGTSEDVALPIKTSSGSSVQTDLAAEIKAIEEELLIETAPKKATGSAAAKPKAKATTKSSSGTASPSTGDSSSSSPSASAPAPIPHPKPVRHTAKMAASPAIPRKVRPAASSKPSSHVINYKGLKSLTFTNPDDLNSAMTTRFHPGSFYGCVLIGYEGKSSKISFKKQGDKVTELVPELNEGEIQY